MKFIVKGYGVVTGSVLVSVHQLHDHAHAMAEYLESEHGRSCSIVYLGGVLEELDPPVIPITGEAAERALIDG